MGLRVMCYIFQKFGGAVLVIVIVFSSAYISKFVVQFAPRELANPQPVNSQPFNPQDYILLGKKMDINSVSVETLEALSGIGPSLAKEIVKYREAHGRFKNIAELTNVKGIGSKKLERIKSYVKVETRL